MRCPRQPIGDEEAIPACRRRSFGVHRCQGRGRTWRCDGGLLQCSHGEHQASPPARFHPLGPSGSQSRGYTEEGGHPRDELVLVNGVGVGDGRRDRSGRLNLKNVRELACWLTVRGGMVLCCCTGVFNAPASWLFTIPLRDRVVPRGKCHDSTRKTTVRASNPVDMPLECISICLGCSFLWGGQATSSNRQVAKNLCFVAVSTNIAGVSPAASVCVVVPCPAIVCVC